MIKIKLSVYFKISAILLAAFMLLLSLAGCSGREPGSTPGTTAEGKTIESASGDGTLTQKDGKEADSDTSGQEVDEMELERKYMDLLGAYLKEQLELEIYDEEIEKLGCQTVDEADQSESQKRANLGLKYLYIRNELHLDRLSDEDTGILRESIGKEEGDEVEKAEEMVVRTFPLCIRPMPYEDEEGRKLKYVYDNTMAAQDGSASVTMDTLLIKIATQSEYDEEGEYVDEYLEVQKEKALYDLAKRMESEMEGLLGDIPIRVFVDFIL